MSGPPLRNYLADLAGRVGELAGRYRRATGTAAESALAAGRLLLEVRAECQHGEWLPFLRAAKLPDRTARNWMRLARSGLGVSNIVAAGGVRAALLTLANPKAIAIVESQLDGPEPESASPEPDPEIGHGGRFDGPDPAERRPVVHETGFAGPGPRSVQADAAAEPRISHRTAPNARQRLIPRLTPE